MTSDNPSRFRKLSDNIVAIGGYNGRGIAPGTVFGKVLADHISGEISDAELPLPITPVGELRFRQLREVAYEDLKVLKLFPSV